MGPGFFFWRRSIALVCLPAFALLAACQAQSTAELTFEVVTARPVEIGESVYVAGNADTLGNWHPRGLALVRTDSLTWKAKVPFVVGHELEFKVTKGTWQTEALLADGSVPPNHRIRVTRDTTARLHVAAWKAGPRLQVTGDVQIHKDLAGPGLKPRDVSVWLPPDYDVDADRRYPVLYAHDGQNLFDPESSTFGVDWQLDENADSLIASGRMRPIIIVGIHNTSDRAQEYHDTVLGQNYREFIIRTLKPMIDATYRTLADRENTAVIGSSSGGFASFLLLWNHPDVFSMAACLSPYFPNAVPTQVAESGWKARDLKLYVDMGGDELDTRLQEGVDGMLQVLESVGFESGDNFTWIRYPDDGHNETSWARRAWRPLRFMFGVEDRR